MDEFGIVILLLLSNINVYFEVFDILYLFCFELIISTIIVLFSLRAQTIAFDSSTRATFNDIFGLPTINMSCGGILCTFAINNAINNYGYYQIKNADLNFMAMSSIIQTFAFSLVSLEIDNSLCCNINSGTFN